MKLLLATAIMFIIGCSSSDTNNSQNPINEDPDQQVLKSLGDITYTAPNDWLQFSETGKFCLHLPSTYTEENVQGDDSLVRQFDGDDGKVLIDYGGFSQGPLFSEKNAIVNGDSATVTLIETDGGSGYFDSSNVYTIYQQVSGDLYFAMTFYATSGNHLELAQQIFGTVRLGSSCP